MHSEARSWSSSILAQDTPTSSSSAASCAAAAAIVFAVAAPSAAALLPLMSFDLLPTAATARSTDARHASTCGASRLGSVPASCRRVAAHGWLAVRSEAGVCQHRLERAAQRPECWQGAHRWLHRHTQQHVQLGRVGGCRAGLSKGQQLPRWPRGPLVRRQALAAAERLPEGGDLLGVAAGEQDGRRRMRLPTDGDALAKF